MSKTIYTIKPATCPECGGQILATREVYLDSVNNGNGTASVFLGKVVGETRWYCENDHTVKVEIQD